MTDRDLLKTLGAIGTVFFGSFSRLREIQRQAIPPILAGRNVLVASPTASGKTEAIVAPLVRRLKASVEVKGKRIQLLVVAPTRALVNDLFKRLETPLSAVGWSCGRQTAEHHQRDSRPDVLITTPESFDSALVRGGSTKAGELVDHVFASVRAVFIDEVHLYEYSPRGDHLQWLIARLKRLRRYALDKDWTNSSALQICAGSATVSNFFRVASKFLGPDHEVVVVSGKREIDILAPNELESWIPLGSLQSTDEVYRRIASLSVRFGGQISEYVWRAIADGAHSGCRKVLVFVPTRQMCDMLSHQLSEELRPRRTIYVAGHHGSLSKTKREEVERQFVSRRDAVLVATSTLEVGIDIGDVDVVALVGSPPDVAALLQRIGRGGRRIGRSRIVPIALNEVEAWALAGMLESVIQGVADSLPGATRPSLVVQQALSVIVQSPQRKRKLSYLLGLAREVLGETAIDRVSHIIEHLLEQEILDRQGDDIFLGTKASDTFSSFRAKLHCNFDAGGMGRPVIDQFGAIIANVEAPPPGVDRVAIAGKSYTVVGTGAEIRVQTTEQKPEAAFVYAPRSRPRTKSFAESVKRGLGLSSDEAPLFSSGKYGTIWFHFSGAAYELILRHLIDGLKTLPHFSGIAARGTVDTENLNILASDTSGIREIVMEKSNFLASFFQLGLYHRDLPLDVQREAVADFFEINAFIEWARSRRIRQISHEEVIWHRLNSFFTT